MLDEKESGIVCKGCDRNCQPPLKEPAEVIADREVDMIVGLVKYLVRWEQSGCVTDWSEYPFEIKRLYVHWRACEHDIGEIRAGRHADYIRMQMTAPANPLLPPAV